MAEESFPYDDVVRNLDGISDKLKEASLYKKEEIKRIEDGRKNIEIAKEYWQTHPIPSSDIAMTPLASGAGFIFQAHNYISGLGPQNYTGEILETVLDVGSSIASAASTFYHIVPPAQLHRERLETKFIEINNPTQRDERKKKAKKLLQKVSDHLGNMYDAAWENVETNFSDPARGAAFLMREVISQVLDFLAPKKVIKELPDFTPDDSAKDGVTRRHRLEYIASIRAKDNFNKDLIEKSIDNFLDTYAALCDAHKRSSLDKSEIESFLLQADNLLILLLTAAKND